MNVRSFLSLLFRSPVSLFAAVILVSLLGGSCAFCGEIHTAAQKGDLAKIKALLKDNPDLVFSKDNQFGVTPLHVAAAQGYKDLAEFLLTAKADVNAKANDGWTPLHFAAAKDRKDVAQLLLAHGADVNAKANKGEAPLHVAAVYGHREVAELLLASQADINAKENLGWTPSHYGAKNGSKDVTELLLAHGADVHAKANKGETPLDVAVANGHQDVAELLRQHGGQLILLNSSQTGSDLTSAWFHDYELGHHIGWCDKPAQGDPAHTLLGCALIPYRDEYRFSLMRASEMPTDLPSVLGTAKKEKKGIWHNEIMGESAPVRLKANDAQRFTVNVQRRMVPGWTAWGGRKIEGVLLPGGGIIDMVSYEVGAILSVTSVRPAISSEIVEGAEFQPRGVGNAVFSRFGVRGTSEIAFRSLFGAPESTLNTFSAQARAGVHIGVPVQFHHFDKANPAIVLVYRLDVKKRSREWWSGVKGGDYAGIPLKVVRYLPGPDNGNLLDPQGRVLFVGDIGGMVVEPTSPLPPGEYAFVTFETDAWFREALPTGGFSLAWGVSVPDKMRFHCFGIDQ